MRFDGGVRTIVGRMRIHVDVDRCAGHGRCYTLVPSLFDADDQGHATVIVTGELNDEQLQAANTAVQNCPEQAISLDGD
jgi:ferredoxin